MPREITTINLRHNRGGRSVHALRHSIAVHLLDAGRGIEDVAAHLGHRNIQNTRMYAQIYHPIREQVFRDLERHPKEHSAGCVEDRELAMCYKR